jgi:hypothetical protein
LVKVIPILPSGDFDDTERFYQPLGFVETGRWANEYLILQRSTDDLELHFWFKPAVDPMKNDVACYVRFDSAQEARSMYEEWQRVDVNPGRLHAPQETDYGLLEFALIDGHGNLLRIGGLLSDT